ncbi:hypothetical protein Tco_0154926 [Tanacetum coccineum]
MDINNNNTLFHHIIYRARQVLEAAQERGLAVVRGMPELWRQFVEAMDDDDVDVALPQSTFTLIISALLAFAAMKSQGNPGFPFETHSQMVKIPSYCLFSYLWFTFCCCLSGETACSKSKSKSGFGGSCSHWTDMLDVDCGCIFGVSPFLLIDTLLYIYLHIYLR